MNIDQAKKVFDENDLFATGCPFDKSGERQSVLN